jgi:hypothetical protein
MENPDPFAADAGGDVAGQRAERPTSSGNCPAVARSRVMISLERSTTSSPT